MFTISRQTCLIETSLYAALESHSHENSIEYIEFDTEFAAQFLHHILLFFIINQ